MDFFDNISRNFSAFLNEGGADGLNQYVKWILPIVAIVIFVRLALALWRRLETSAPVATLSLPNGMRQDITRLECSIGRGASSDIVIDYPSVSRSHAVLSRRGGRWFVSDLRSKAGISVNGNTVEKKCEIKFGDTLSLAGAEMKFLKPDRHGPPEADSEQLPSGEGFTLLLVTLFQICSFMASLFAREERELSIIPILTALVVLEWGYYFFSRYRSRSGISLEIAAFWLSGIGLCAVSAVKPDALPKQSATCAVGIILFFVLVWFLSDLRRAQRFRYPMGAAAIALFAANIGLGHARFGSRNWIQIGDFTVQPSEFIKIAFVYAEAAPLDRLLTTKNLTLSILFSGACIGSLFFMGDFGTALIFFVTFLIMAFIRSGDLRTIALICSVAAIGAYVIMAIRPYIANRFAAWRHVWEFADSSGYQQTRTLMYSGSGGLTGLGVGEGRLKYISASDTDLVFGILCEEWGLIVAILAALTVALFAIHAVRSGKFTSSSFYIITSVSAASLMVFQLSLNIFGATDILPLTGVTFPFVSNGGSSIIASWGLLALIKSVQNRT